MTTLSPVGDLLVVKLRRYLSSSRALATVQSCCARLGISPGEIRKHDLSGLIDVLDGSSGLALPPEERFEAIQSLRRWASGSANGLPRAESRIVRISTEVDVRDARIAAMEMAETIGFVHQDATKVATVVSELSRNTLSYANGGTIRLSQEDRPRRGIRVSAQDEGPGIANLEEVLAGTYRSRHGLGLGLRGSKRIMDVFEIDTKPGEGTRITAVKYLVA